MSGVIEKHVSAHGLRVALLCRFGNPWRLGRANLLSLSEYQNLFAGKPAPTGGQIDAFVVFVAGMHSWYKHLPLVPPGVRFHVYLDPNAGLGQFQSADGRSGYREIVEDETLFHYSMLPTCVYRERFGFLNVADGVAPPV